MYALMCDNVIVAKYDSEKEVFRLEDVVPEFLYQGIYSEMVKKK